MSSSPEPNLEIELRFFVTDVPALQQQLSHLPSFQFIQKKTFRDVYWDTFLAQEHESFLLTKNDVWLRSREQDWECKVSRRYSAAIPTPTSSSSSISAPLSASHVAQYEEIVSPSKINTFLRNHFPGLHNLPMPTSSPLALSQIVSEPFQPPTVPEVLPQCLTPVIVVTTHRHIFRVQDSLHPTPYTVVLDEVEEGEPVIRDLNASQSPTPRKCKSFAVGEVETMVDKWEDADLAATRIAEFCRKLGLGQTAGAPDSPSSERKPIPSKVETFLRWHNPLHYEVLFQAGVLSVKPNPN